MPKRLHAQLEKQAKEKGLTGARKDAYVYGTMRQIAAQQAKKASMK